MTTTRIQQDQQDHSQILRAELVNGFLFRTCSITRKTIESIYHLVSEVNLDCDKDGIRIQGLSVCRIGFAAIELGPEAFFRYHCGRPLAMGIKEQ